MDQHLRGWVEDALGARVVGARRGFGGGSRELWFVETVRDGESTPVVVHQESGAGAFSGTPMSLGREAVVYRALEPTEVPVARLLAASPRGDALILEHLAGSARLDGLSPSDSSRVLADFVDAIARVHALDPERLELHGFDRPSRPEDHALVDLARWTAILRDHVAEPDPLIEYAIGWLRQHPPRRVQRTVLVQGDTGPGNFMHHGGAVTGLVDWEFAHIGDPMDDLAWIDMRSESTAFGDPATRDRLYEAATGLEVDQDAVRYYAVLVQLRCAITTALTISRGGGAVGLGAYYAPHHRFVVQLGLALADAIGFEATVLAIPDVPDTAMTPVYDHAIRGLDDDVLPGLDDPTAKLRTRAARLVLEHDRAADRLAAHIAEADGADVVATLDRRVATDELRVIAGRAGTAADRSVLDLLCRLAQRARLVWDTPGVGGPSAPRPPPRHRAAER